MAWSLTLAPNAIPSKVAKLVNSYCGHPVEESPGDDLCLTTASTKASGMTSVCSEIAAHSSRAEQLLGDTSELQAAVQDELCSVHDELTPLTDDGLNELNAKLAQRVFLLGGSQPSLVDLVLFGHTHAATSSFPAAQTQHFANLLRWADHISRIADPDALFSRLSFTRPAFVAPPPPPPAPKKGGVAPSATPTPAAPAASAPVTPPPASAPPQDAAPAGREPAVAGEKPGKKAKKEKAPKPPPVAAEVGIDMLDIRVGTITSVDVHPNADSLYLEEIDVGEAKPRQVISGLVKFVPVEQMRGRRVLVVLNLKPAKMREVLSSGMVLCASNEEHTAVEPLTPPEGVPNGERVVCEGWAADPEAQINPKKKILEKLFPDMACDTNGVPCYKGVPMSTSAGPVLASSLPGANVR